MSTAVLEPRGTTFAAPPVAMGDLFPYPSPTRLVGAAADPGDPRLLQLRFEGGTSRTIALVTLRDACCCTACRHPASLERTQDQLRIDPEIRAERLDLVAGGELEVAWSDGHLSCYTSGWLVAGGRFEEVMPPPPVRLWDRSLVIPRFEYDAVVSDASVRLAWLEALAGHGIAYVTGAPVQPASVLSLIGRVGTVRPTNFGAVFDVRAVIDAISNAYTAIDLPLHVDLPAREHMPGYQFLHCIANEAAGGASVYADGYAMAQDLRAEDPPAFHTLGEVPIRFRYHDETTDYVAIRPLITVGAAGEVEEIRFNTSLMTSFQVAPERTAEVWRAYRQFLERTRDPAFQVETRMAPGDIACFDNRRVLHGRRAFEPSTGLRHLQGAYLERDDVLSALRVLQRRSA